MRLDFDFKNNKNIRFDYQSSTRTRHTELLLINVYFFTWKQGNYGGQNYLYIGIDNVPHQFYVNMVNRVKY